MIIIMIKWANKQTNKTAKCKKQTSEIHHQTNEKKFVLNKRRIPYDDDLRIQTKIKNRNKIFFFERPILENIISGDIPVMFFVFLVFFVIDFLITGKKFTD